MNNVEKAGKARGESGGEELSLLFEAARIFVRHVDFRAALDSVLRILESRTALSGGTVRLLERATGLLKAEAAFGSVPGEKTKGTYRLGEGSVGRVFETGEVLAREQKGAFVYCVPIMSGNKVSGVLSAAWRIPAAGRMELLEKISSIISDSVKLRERIGKGDFRPPEAAPDKSRRDGSSFPDGEGAYIALGSGIIGRDTATRNVFEMLKQVASSDATVLITGESGTGKELAAAELHRLSKRAAAPLVRVNCATLPESVIESELFGHEKGAFTGATNLRKGRFELAQGGSIFLDEIGELSLQVQVKLLRVLQERELERVGGSETLKINVRLIAATNRNLEADVRAGRFREDLYYRLNVFPIHIPPLRERKSDIILLADHFAGKYAEKNGKLIKRISTPAIELLTSYSWPGNIRELENCIERAVILSEDMVIHSYNLPPSLQSAVSTNTEPAATLEAALSRLEKELIVEALKISGGNMAAAARRLGITERQMGLRVHHYGINRKLYKI